LFKNVEDCELAKERVLVALKANYCNISTNTYFNIIRDLRSFIVTKISQMMFGVWSIFKLVAAWQVAEKLKRSLLKDTPSVRLVTPSSH
jgi:hypothetical protein